MASTLPAPDLKGAWELAIKEEANPASPEQTILEKLRGCPEQPLNGGRAGGGESTGGGSAPRLLGLIGATDLTVDACRLAPKYYVS